MDVFLDHFGALYDVGAHPEGAARQPSDCPLTERRSPQSRRPADRQSEIRAASGPYRAPITRKWPRGLFIACDRSGGHHRG